MQTFLQAFALSVAGVLQGFDRLVFRGRLPSLYSPNGMDYYLAANHVLRKEFKIHAAEVTGKILGASLVAHAKGLDRYRYLNSCNIDTEKTALAIAAKHKVQQGLVCVLQRVEPCWTFDSTKNKEGMLTIRGEPGKCSQLYHYYIHPVFGWMYVRLQTWFPFDIQVGMNGREWLARQMDLDKMSYERSDNKFLWVEDWARAQQLANQQLQTPWAKELDALQQQVHPLHPHHLGRMPLPYNWTVYQSEWATDIAFHDQAELSAWFDRWLRQGFLSYDSVDVLRYLGRSGRIRKDGSSQVQTTVREVHEGKRIKHEADRNAVKLYTHLNVLRPETTINCPEKIMVLRPPANDPEAPAGMRPLRRSVEDMDRRVAVSQAANERYLEALATMKETRTVKELAEPMTRRVPAPSRSRAKAGKPIRQVRALNPLAAEDAALLTAVSDPKWMVHGMRNRDLVALLYPEPTLDPKERRRRSARVTRLLRLLRAHGLLEKVTGTHRYQMSAVGRVNVQAVLAVRNANPDELTTKAA
jgi:hypothetical protein